MVMLRQAENPSNTSTVPGLLLSDMIPVLYKTYFFHKRQNALLKSAELDKCLFVLWFNITIKKFSAMLGQSHCFKPGPEVIKLFSISAQLSMKFQLLINAEIVKISGKFGIKPQKLVIYPANKC